MSRESYMSFAMNARAECHSDDTPVPLSPDQKSVVRDAVSRAMHAAQFVGEMAAKDTLVVSTRANGLSVAFSELDRVAKAIGFDADREQEHNATRSVLRAANERIRELEQQLAGSVTGEALAQAVAKACDSISPAWKKAGFNYVGDISLNRMHLEAKLSCDADDGMFSFSETPETDKESAKVRRASLEERGIKFSGDGRQRRDRSAFDTDANKSAIARIIQEIWPRAKILKWETGYTTFGHMDNFIIRYVWVVIPIESLMGEGPTVTKG